jgi:hypothetical protein
MAKKKKKKKSRLSFKPMGNKPMNLSFPRSFTKAFLHKKIEKLCILMYIHT